MSYELEAVRAYYTTVLALQCTFPAVSIREISMSTSPCSSVTGAFRVSMNLFIPFDNTFTKAHTKRLDTFCKRLRITARLPIASIFPESYVLHYRIVEPAVIMSPFYNAGEFAVKVTKRLKRIWVTNPIEKLVEVLYTEFLGPEAKPLPSLGITYLDIPLYARG